MDKIDKQNARRAFLTRCSHLAMGSAAAWATMGRLQMAHAASGGLDEYRALVCVYLFGGNDSFNMVVPSTPTAHAAYAAARPNLTIDRATLLPITPSNSNGIDYGLHPSMPELQQLFNAGNAALLANVGPLIAPTTLDQFKNNRVPLPPELFSHVDQQAYSMSMGSETQARNGWGGKIADRLGITSPGGIPPSITLSGSNMWHGGAASGIYTMSGNGASTLDRSLIDPNRYWERGTSRRDAFRKLIDIANREQNVFMREHARMTKRAIDFSEFASKALAGVPEPATVFPANNRLASSLKTVARTIAARRALGQKKQIFFVGIGGWDTHDSHLVDHAELLATISQALSAFYQATIELGVAKQVTTFTMTDFGRTLNNNGDGTDHGWGGHSWILGGDVVGRKIYGLMPDLALGSALDAGRGRMIPTTSIEQLGATMSRWMGVAYGATREIFPNLRNFSLDYLPMLASTNRQINEIDFNRHTGGGGKK